MKSNRSRRRKRPGFTLVEVATSLAIITVLLLGLSGAVLVSSHAIPTAAESGIVDQRVIDVMNRIRGEFQGAEEISFASNASEIRYRLQLVDNGASGWPDTVQYVYDKSAYTISRQAKGGDEVILLTDVNFFLGSFTINSGKASFAYMLLSVNGSIQHFYEMHEPLPYNPEVS